MNRNDILRMFILTFAIKLFLTGCTDIEKKDQEIYIAAAASLQNVLQELKQSYEEKNPGVKIIFNFASSGTLQKQIEQGAPIDIFISAGVKQMDGLEERNLIIKDSRENLLTNNLVLIVPLDNPGKISTVQDLVSPKVRSISIGLPETVPAGGYAREALLNLKLWEKVEEIIVYAKDVKQVLAYVESGNIDAGLVYQSDVRDSNKVQVIEAISADIHEPIVYPIAIIKDTKIKAEAESFISYLRNSPNQKVFKEYGYTP